MTSSSGSNAGPFAGSRDEKKEEDEFHRMETEEPGSTSEIPDYTTASRTDSNKRLLVRHRRQHQQPPPVDKPVGPPKDESCCICLSEDVHHRGKLDCCDHFFCYPCIVRWSRTESRCPLCKQRFGTITQEHLVVSAGSSSLLIPLVKVPARDQPLYFSDEEDEDLSNRSCIVCLRGGDEDLFMQCLLCSREAHTYCAGLGLSLPQGDWICNPCQVIEDSKDPTFTTADLDEEEDSSDSDLEGASYPNLNIVNRTRSRAANEGRVPFSRSTHMALRSRPSAANQGVLRSTPMAQIRPPAAANQEVPSTRSYPRALRRIPSIGSQRVGVRRRTQVTRRPRLATADRQVSLRSTHMTLRPRPSIGNRRVGLRSSTHMALRPKPNQGVP